MIIRDITAFETTFTLKKSDLKLFLIKDGTETQINDNNFLLILNNNVELNFNVYENNNETSICHQNNSISIPIKAHNNNSERYLKSQEKKIKKIKITKSTKNMKSNYTKHNSVNSMFDTNIEVEINSDSEIYIPNEKYINKKRNLKKIKTTSHEDDSFILDSLFSKPIYNKTISLSKINTNFSDDEENYYNKEIMESDVSCKLSQYSC